MNSRYGAVSANHSPVLLRRALEALNAILKEFINIKLLSGIKTMGMVGHYVAILKQHFSVFPDR
jgi:hypothetical protein